ncbi:AlpA family phage regulatory protein [Acidithiobacillus sp. HP-6]|jgi:prophage regulatory protein|uniref:helix-turn-helix transcriptional regulator n=1 Tax=unclassified Acidithiobacillus TaxID=2614800 RepID=UPI001879D8D3|nr:MULTISPECIES: AlpA family phage regulatory protein [unclassified Acidithiobacillus]MBE7562988.1 AlpA family phage regulatory protein [Acidithiobacillus sp. HP-6]MBE7567804.1 AlpA family phage regulatory protein [Acidithiobacillus sp. HP-11]MBE7569897.1 AlpA family phage regulatory protein [Acidithiobacillus sp. HP-2]
MDTVVTKQQPHRLLRFNEVKYRTGLCRTSIYNRIANGEFPSPRKLGRISVWLEAEIDQWVLDIAQTQKGGNL